jgi:NADPH:quinone reductase-like Zn-dependent oxidoreductase
MRAARFHKFGPAREVLELCDIDTPEPGPGEVLVRLHTSAINPSDVKKRAGAFPDLLDGGFVIPNSGLGIPGTARTPFRNGRGVCRNQQ